MRPGRSVIVWMLVAGAAHAVILLSARAPRPPEPAIPTVELTLEAEAGGSAELAPGPAAPGPAPRAERAAPGPATAPTPAPTPAEAPAPVPILEQPAAPTPAVEAVPGDPAPTPAVGPAVTSAAPALGGGAVDPGPVTGTLASAAAAGGSSGGGGGEGGGGGGGRARAAVDEPARDLVPPQPRTRINPDYPRSARASGAEGTVMVTALVDAGGRVLSVEVTTSSGTRSLDESALAEVRSKTFRPATRDGVPVACRLRIPVRFQLKPHP
jgi:periplasmic protein TonB